MKKSINNNILYRFLNKETSELENQEIFDWVSYSEENRAEFRKVHNLFHEQLNSGIDVDQAWNRLNYKLSEVNGRPSLIRFEQFRRIAAAILILLTIGFGSLWFRDHFFNSSDSVIVQFEAPKGEKSKIILADGSHVWLNSQTILKYDALHPRKVILQGEAYFEIKKDQTHPFEVITSSGMIVVVTGTRFNLRCYENESYVETTLEEGQVAIKGNNSVQLAVLQPGQQAKYDIADNLLKVENVTAKIYSIWRNNELHFSDISFAELIPQIERWYGISIKLDPKIGNRDRFTMIIKTESLRELLNMMKLTSRFDYEVDGENIELYAK